MSIESLGEVVEWDAGFLSIGSLGDIDRVLKFTHGCLFYAAIRNLWAFNDLLSSIIVAYLVGDLEWVFLVI